MRSDIVRTPRERYTFRHVLSFAVLLALIYGITRDEGVLLGITLAVSISEVVNLSRKTPGIDGRWGRVGLGAVITLVSLAWVGYEYTVVSNTSGPVWFPLLTALIDV